MMGFLRSETIPADPRLSRIPTVALELAGDATPPAIAVLTRRLGAGDEGAFREFHAAYFDRLHHFLLVVTRGEEHAAQDALQETMLRVVRYVRTFEREDVFWDWLKVVARSAARDGGRKRRRYAALLERFGSGHGTAEPAADAPDSRMRATLDEALAELAADERALIEGKYLRGLTVAELAASTALTEKAVESRLHRLRQQLAGAILEKLRTP